VESGRGWVRKETRQDGRMRQLERTRTVLQADVRMAERSGVGIEAAPGGLLRFGGHRRGVFGFKWARPGYRLTAEARAAASTKRRAGTPAIFLSVGIPADLAGTTNGGGKLPGSLENRAI
jgi:hypothetical protein